MGKVLLIGIISKEGFGDDFIRVLEVNFVGEVFRLLRVVILFNIIFVYSIGLNVFEYFWIKVNILNIWLFF